jgi:hypothetical protein
VGASANALLTIPQSKVEMIAINIHGWGGLTDSICARVFKIQIPQELIARKHDD